MHESLPAMHRATAERLGTQTALRHWVDGQFQDISWRTSRRRADEAAAGLIALGINAGERIALLSENHLSWILADQAILSVGAISVPQHAPLAPPQVEYQMQHSDARAIVVSGQQQADKILTVLEHLPQLEVMISIEALERDLPIHTLNWSELTQLGRSEGEAGRLRVRAREAMLGSGDLATILYTSGTTGRPKGVMLTHGNLLSNAAASLENSEIKPGDVLLSWLPYSHIYARCIDLYVTAMGGVTVVLARSVDTLLEDLAAIQPSWLTAVPRFYEKIWAAVERLADADRAAQLHAIFGPNIRLLFSGGAPLPMYLWEGYRKAGLPLLEGYGLTETSPVISANNLEEFKVGSVGRALPGIEVKVADDGEVLTRGPHVMKGYWKDPEATASTIIDGWLHTGDIGHLDKDGYLSITDRKKDMIITSGGKNIAPSELELLLTSNPHIDQAVVYGDGRRFVAALLTPNPEMLSALCDRLKCDRDLKDGFICSPPLLSSYEEFVSSAMQGISTPEQVKKFLLLDRPFELARDEMTATLKVRRRHVIKLYEPQLTALYEAG